MITYGVFLTVLTIIISCPVIVTNYKVQRNGNSIKEIYEN